MQTLQIEAIKTADLLQKSEQATIHSLKTTELSVKLLQMGCLPGKKITHVRSAAGGSPIYLRVENQFFALRREEAAQIVIYNQSGK